MPHLRNDVRLRTLGKMLEAMDALRTLTMHSHRWCPGRGHRERPSSMGVEVSSRSRHSRDRWRTVHIGSTVFRLAHGTSRILRDEIMGTVVRRLRNKLSALKQVNVSYSRWMAPDHEILSTIFYRLRNEE
jgi:hypothetical protein